MSETINVDNNAGQQIIFDDLENVKNPISAIIRRAAFMARALAGRITVDLKLAYKLDKSEFDQLNELADLLSDHNMDDLELLKNNIKTGEK